MSWLFPTHFPTLGSIFFKLYKWKKWHLVAMIYISLLVWKKHLIMLIGHLYLLFVNCSFFSWGIFPSCSLVWFLYILLLLISSSVISDSLWPHGLQHVRLLCPSPSPRVCSNSCPLSRWCHPTILSSVVSFSTCLQSFPASGSFPMNWLFTSGSENIGA